MRFFALAFIIFCICLAGGLTGCSNGSHGEHDVRVATFNIAMGLKQPGELGKALAGGKDTRLQQVAEILQRIRPDIVLLNEFDYDPGIDAAALLNDNYLAHGQNGREPIHYPYHFRAPVNTGLDSGMDLDGDGETGGPGDAWGFGHFPGQYGMLVLSRYPIDLQASRTFQNFLWSALPNARRPANPDGSLFYPDEVWQRLRLSSKGHWDLRFNIDGKDFHLLAFHPTPPVFDGPENRNGLRNFDEIRFWRDYTYPSGAPHIIDDEGVRGGIGDDGPFVVAGDFNADPLDGDSVANAAGQLLQASWFNSDCVPVSIGAEQAAQRQGGLNMDHRGTAAADTADFNDRYTGNLRLDYVLPSKQLAVTGCGVFWPAPDEDGHDLVEVSDHRLVWLDISL